MSNKLSSKQIIIGIVVVILLLNIMWTVMQNKFTPKLEEVNASVKSVITSVVDRVTKLEQGGLPDVADLKEDFAALKVVSDKFSDRLNKLIKAEQDQLESIEAQLEAYKAQAEAQIEAYKAQAEAQKARVEELKKLAAE